MSLTSALAIYFVMWWIVLFAVLPWGIRSQHEGEAEISPGTDPGAPLVPALGRKLVWTTIVTTIIFALSYGVFAFGVLTFDDIARLSPI